MSREYKIDPKHLQRLHRPPSTELSNYESQETDNTHASNTCTQYAAKKLWSPINPKYHEDDSSDDDDEDEY